jgi:hypothetical protein
MALKRNEEGRREWTNDDNRWGPRAGQVAHPAYVEYVEDLIDEGNVYMAFKLIMYPIYFYGPPDPDASPGTNAFDVCGCPELFNNGQPRWPSLPTDAERRHLTAYALDAALDVRVMIYAEDSVGIDYGPDPELGADPAEQDVPRVRGLVLTHEIVEWLTYLIAPPATLLGETQPDEELDAAIARIVERHPNISNRALAKKLGTSERTIRRRRPPK